MLFLIMGENRLQVEFGGRVRRLRTERGLSQEQLALRTGLDRTYISGIERGVRNPSLRIIFKLSEALSTSLSEMMHIQ